MRIVVIGAGISGLACADMLRMGGVDVTLFDKGRGPGGRMSSRRADTPEGPVSFDHGAQYFTVRDPAFADQLAIWAARGVVAPWPEAGADAWVGMPAMNAPVRDLAERLGAHFGRHVHGLFRTPEGWTVRLEDGTEGPYDAAIVALPAEQAATMLSLHDLTMARMAMSARSQPCWTAMIAFADRLDHAADHLRDRGIIAWAARNSAKPGRSGPDAWVVQAYGSWSAAHLEEDAGTVADRLLAALGEETGAALPPVLSLSAHRWRFAMTGGTDHGALWNGAIGLGACGDWLLGPRVELAWLSGRKLAARILDTGNAATPDAAPARRAGGLG